MTVDVKRKTRWAVFVSGTGSNLRALVEREQTDSTWPAEIVAVVSDKPQCSAVAFAQSEGIPVFAENPRTFASVEAFEGQVLSFLRDSQVEYIALAGYMRIVREVLLKAFSNRILNIHPALLPSFPGKQAVLDAYTAGVDKTGVTVHLVDEGVDTGPILAQVTVEIHRELGLDALYDAIHRAEHKLYGDVIAKVAVKGTVIAKVAHKGTVIERDTVEAGASKLFNGGITVRKWALVSVSDKNGVVEFCRKLVDAGYGILSTGGTAKHLTAAGIEVTEVSDYTGFPEMMDGRVKTLHPKIHGGILGIRDNAQHERSMLENGIDAIDLVIVNLYPFAETINKPTSTVAEAVEMIDIGGPSLLRAAAKNYRFCVPVVDAADYAWIAQRIAEGKPISLCERTSLAAKVYATTAQYDALIASYLGEEASRQATRAHDSRSGMYPTDADVHPVQGTAETAASPAGSDDSLLMKSKWPGLFNVSFVHKQDLRYGENPHQDAHFYSEANPSPASIAGAAQLHGKELSYNNIQDADAALGILRSFDDFQQPTAVAVKHMNPCGVGIGQTIDEAFARAFEADPVSIFGGIVAVNRQVTETLAARLSEMFLEIIIAPSFSPEALHVLTRKKNVRLLTVSVEDSLWRWGDKVFRRVSGGLLVQSVDTKPISRWTTVTNRAPSEAEMKAMQFAWRIVGFVKSNAIVLANDTMTLGIGAGQMNRVGAAKIAIEQAGSKAKGSVMASDAFFPMPDTVEAAVAAGVTAIVQPGGSKRDEDSIRVANEHDIAMVFTGLRHFLH